MIPGAAISYFAYSSENKYHRFSKPVKRVDRILLGYELVKIKNGNRKVPVARYITQSGIAFTQNPPVSFLQPIQKKEHL
jgi:hypothetical protein